MARAKEPRVRLIQRSEPDPTIIACPRCGESLDRIDVNEAWVEVPTGDGWIAAYRIVRAGTRQTIGEIRVFPDERKRDPGRWSGRAASVPEGGLPGSVLRDLTVSSALERFDAIIERWDADTGGYVSAEVLKRFGLERSGETAPKRPGRAGRDALYFATWAAAYVEQIQSGNTHPIETLAQDPPVRFRGDKRKLSPHTVRGIIVEARGRKLLSPAPRGKAGGELTGRALRILGQHG